MVVIFFPFTEHSVPSTKLGTLYYYINLFHSYKMPVIKGAYPNIQYQDRNHKHSISKDKEVRTIFLLELQICWPAKVSHSPVYEYNFVWFYIH